MSLTPRQQNALLVAAACIAAVSLFEIVGNLLLRPDDRSSGTLLGIQLPPIRISGSERHLETRRDVPYQGIVVDGHAITLGDLSGYYRYDELLGYAVLENSVSANGWWQSNNIGARESTPTTDRVSEGIKRLLLIGDSFAHGSGVPGSQAWAELLDSANASLDIVNLGVDGYGMGQAYLRYQSVKDTVEHDGVVMMFVPTADLWRDVNTIRDLGEFWNVQIVMPRYVVEGDELRLVRSPYRHPTDIYRDNRSGLSPTLRNHLRRYDRFYFWPLYEDAPLLGRLVSYRTVAAAYGRLAWRLEWRSLMEPDSEAMRVSRAIFTALQRDLRGQSRDFYLLILPTPWDLELFRRNSDHMNAWKAMVAYTCAEVARCIDLAPALFSKPQDAIDAGYDGNHFGPKANRVIMSAVEKAILDGEE